MITTTRPTSWSKSQMTQLKECRRKMFFSSQAMDVFPDTPQLAQIPTLKKLKNRHLWLGSFLHEEVGNLLKVLRQGEPLPNIALVLEQAKDKLRSQYKLSKEGNAQYRLFEHQFGIPVEMAEWQKIWTKAENGLKWFLQSKWCERLSRLGPECWKSIDEVLSFELDETKVYVKMDVAVEIEGRFFILDWKTSTPRQSAEDSLLVSALYAHDVWGAEVEQIQAMAVSLADGSTHHAQINEETLMQTHLKIQEESALLETARHENESISQFQNIPAAPLSTCGSCSYQSICHPDGILIHDIV